MRNTARLTVGLLALSGMLLGGRAEAATGNGPYYAEPAWDQKQAAATRFIVLTDWNSEAVLDRETGLVWEKNPTTTVAPPTGQTWATARSTCANKTVGGRKGWRLPSMPELASLVDPSVAAPGPTLPPGHPFTNVQSAVYWSAATSAENPFLAWVVFFTNGDVSDVFNKANSGQVWCVRGGMNADAY